MDEKSRRNFVRRMTPVIRAVVRLHVRTMPRSMANDVDDLVHDIFALLFGDDGRDLKKWDETRGSEETFVRMYATSRMLDFARKQRRRTDLFGRPVPLDEALEIESRVPRPDDLTEIRNLALAVVKCVERAFPTPLGRQMIQLILIDQRSTDETAQKSDKSRDQVIRWRSRLMVRARTCLGTILDDGDGRGTSA